MASSAPSSTSLIDADGSAAPARAQKIDAFVVRDAKEPALERAGVAQLADAVKGVDERVLHDVLAVARVSRHARAEAMEIRAQGVALLVETPARLRDLLTQLFLHRVPRAAPRTIGGARRIREKRRIPERASVVSRARGRPMLIYYDWNTSPNCLKTKILLYELGIAYEQRNVDRALLEGADFRAKFPAGQAPALEDGEVRISESGAIALYLAGKHGGLVPTDTGRRARMFQALFMEAALLAPTVGGQGLFGELHKSEGERNATRIAELRRKAQNVARVLGGVLADRPYFAEEFSIADIQLYAGTAKSLEAGVFEDAPQNLVAWCARMGERPTVARARQEYVPYRQ